ncbi:hypothetical protein [Megamonas funiformis]|uniref:hypothetical protein n=1 Tax=Megamonas funiformis TaxID=437897 RepID=UPI002676828A|nr:hypothetical protein [Megamonas funiformis]
MRKRYITRRIVSTVATCNVWNNESKEITEEKVTVGAAVNEKNLEKVITKELLEDGKKLLEIVTTESVEAVYRMDEKKFIELATIVPVKTDAE